MIVTVTPAPAIDMTIQLERLTLGAVNRAQVCTREPSGKGVNVSWALKSAGRETHAVLPAAGNAAELIAKALSGAGIEHTITKSDHEVRTNITLLTEGHATKINEPAPRLSVENLLRFKEAVIAASGDASSLLICGSLPLETPATFIKELIPDIRAVNADINIGVDTSGPALVSAVEASPNLVKPNIHELAELVNMNIDTLGSAIRACQQARRMGAHSVLASLGPDGALLVDAGGVLYARASGIPFVNSVGAGDALLAGFFSTSGTRSERLSEALLWASSAVGSHTTLTSVREELRPHITVTDAPSPRVPLTEPAEVPLGIEATI